VSSRVSKINSKIKINSNRKVLRHSPQHDNGNINIEKQTQGASSAAAQQQQPQGASSATAGSAWPSLDKHRAL
jgi:hypothetical protein